MMTLPVVVILALIAVAGCSESVKEDGAIDVINLQEAVDNIGSVKLSSIAESLDYIPLETTPECFIGGNHNFAVKGGSGLFFGASFSEMVGAHHFTEEGKYLGAIGKKGRAKGEFVFPTHIVPSPDRDVIAIGSPQKFVVYSLDGEFVSEQDYAELNEMYSPFIIQLRDIGNGSYFNVIGAKKGVKKGEENIFVSIYDQENNLKLYPVCETETVEFHLPDRGETISMPAMGLCYESDNKLYYTHTSEDTLYRFNEEYRLEPLYKLDYGRYAAAKKSHDYDNTIGLSRSSNFKRLTILEKGIIIHLRVPVADMPQGNVSGSDRFVEHMAYYDIASGLTKGISFDHTKGLLGFENDIDGGAPFDPLLVNGGKMYQVIGAIEFIELASKCNSERMKEIASGLTEESNPVVVVATLK